MQFTFPVDFLPCFVSMINQSFLLLLIKQIELKLILAICVFTKQSVPSSPITKLIKIQKLFRVKRIIRNCQNSQTVRDMVWYSLALARQIAGLVKKNQQSEKKRPISFVRLMEGRRACNSLCFCVNKRAEIKGTNVERHQKKIALRWKDLSLVYQNYFFMCLLTGCSQFVENHLSSAPCVHTQVSRVGRAP